MKNMTIKDLKEILNECPDNMPIIIPIIDEDDVNHIYGFREDVGVLIVGRKRPNQSVDIINAFQGKEAEELYKKLVGKKGVLVV